MKISPSAILYLSSCIVTTHAGHWLENHDITDRRLQGTQILDPSDVTDCADQNYVLLLSVQNQHVGFSAIPECQKPESVNAGTNCSEECPLLAFHAVINGDVLEKQLFSYSEDPPEGLEVGTYPLGNLLGAYESVPAGALGNRHSFVGNNCASFLLNMMSHLGINYVHPKYARYVSQRLSETVQSRVVECLSQEPEGLDLVAAHSNDDKLVEDFVSTYVSNHARKLHHGWEAEDPAQLLSSAASSRVAAMAGSVLLVLVCALL